MQSATFNTDSNNDVLINTLDLDDFNSRVIAYNALTNAKSLAKCANSFKNGIIKVCDVVTTKGVRPAQGDNTETECINVYLIDIDGNGYFTQSDGIRRSIEALVTAFGNNFKSLFPNGYAPMKVITEVGDNGHTRKSIVIVNES